jgi:hypothetical protein
VRVVFDGQAAPAETPEADYRGLRVRFAYKATADDAIEEELSRTPPGGAVVVSDDARLHEAARRRGCPAWGCMKFVDWLIEPAKVPRASAPAAEKPEPAGAEEELLKAFSAPLPRRKPATSPPAR